MTALMYDSAVVSFARGELDWPGDAHKAMLLSESYEPAQDSDVVRADVSSFEIEAQGYNRGGKTLGARSIDRPSANDVRLTGGQVQWQRFTGEFRYVVVYQDTGDRDRDRLVCVSDVGLHRAVDSTVTVDWSQGGVAAFMVATADGS